MNYIAAIVSLVATAILTLPILYITDDRITTEKEKFKTSVKPKKKQVIGYMKGTEPYESEDIQTTFEAVKAKKKEPDDNKNWVCVYQIHSERNPVRISFQEKRGYPAKYQTVLRRGPP